MHYYYTCQKRRREHACDKKNVIREQIEKSVAQAIKQYMLTDEMIRGLVKMVKIYEDTRVEVVLNYSEDREKLETVLKELEAEYGDR